MRICDYHKQDNKSVLDLPTPLELYKTEHTAEEYEDLIAFYSSDEWKEVEREHLNSDRRYYEKRKAMSIFGFTLFLKQGTLYQKLFISIFFHATMVPGVIWAEKCSTWHPKWSLRSRWTGGGMKQTAKRRSYLWQFAVCCR